MVRQAYGALDMAKALARLMEMATGVCCTSWGSSSTAPAGSGLLFEEVCFFKSRADFLYVLWLLPPPILEWSVPAGSWSKCSCCLAMLSENLWGNWRSKGRLFSSVNPKSLLHPLKSSLWCLHWHLLTALGLLLPVPVLFWDWIYITASWNCSCLCPPSPAQSSSQVSLSQWELFDPLWLLDWDMKYLPSLGRVLFGFFPQFLLVSEETGDSPILGSKVHHFGKSWDTPFFLRPCCPMWWDACPGRMSPPFSLPGHIPADASGHRGEGGGESRICPPCTPGSTLGDALVPWAMSSCRLGALWEIAHGLGWKLC